jgi:hypothetical protein
VTSVTLPHLGNSGRVSGGGGLWAGSSGRWRGIVTTANIDFAMVPEGLQRGIRWRSGYRHLA